MQGPTRSMTLDELKTYVGKEVGVSEWFTLDQDRIDRFADVTEDHMFLHVNPEAAKATPFVPIEKSVPRPPCPPADVDP